MESKMQVHEGNLFEPLYPNEKFDVIFWNTPFGFVDTKIKLSSLQKATFDPGYIATKQFITEAPNYLTQHGRVYIGFSSTLGKLNLLQQFAESIDYNLKLLHEETSKEIYPVKFEIFELKKILEV